LVTRQIAAFAPIKHLSLTDPHLTANLRHENGNLIVELSSKSLALVVEVSLVGADVVFSDNYFDVLPNQIVIIKLSRPIATVVAKSLFDTMK